MLGSHFFIFQISCSYGSDRSCRQGALKGNKGIIRYSFIPSFGQKHPWSANRTTEHAPRGLISISVGRLSTQVSHLYHRSCPSQQPPASNDSCTKPTLPKNQYQKIRARESHYRIPRGLPWLSVQLKVRILLLVSIKISASGNASEFGSREGKALPDQ